MVEKIVSLRLRQEIIKKARWKRKKFAISFVKKILEKIAKDKVYLSKELSNSIYKIPSRIRIRISKNGKWKADLIK